MWAVPGLLIWVFFNSVLLLELRISEVLKMVCKLSSVILALSILTACASPAVPSPTPVPTPTTISTPTALPDCRQMAGFIEKICTDPVTGLNYLVFIPSSTSAISGAALPLLVYLHGSSLIGSDPEVLLFSGIPAEIEKGRDIPMIVVSPQCPYGEN